MVAEIRLPRFDFSLPGLLFPLPHLPTVIGMIKENETLTLTRLILSQ
jgi:hypothetical protein